MRTTLDIDEDVLAAAKELARNQNLSAGQVVSRLLRKVLTGQMVIPLRPKGGKKSAPLVAGFRPFSTGDVVVTNDLVNRLREAESI